LAQRAENFEESLFSKIVKRATSVISEVASKFTSSPDKLSPDAERETLIQYLRASDDLCLVILWFHVHATGYRPLIDEAFGEWNIPTAILEFDHAGMFQMVSKDLSLFLYEGDESKASYKGGKYSIIIHQAYQNYSG
jgi:hypothetical protein